MLMAVYCVKGSSNSEYCFEEFIEIISKIHEKSIKEGESTSLAEGSILYKQNKVIYN